MSELTIKNHLIKSYKPTICVPVIGTTKEEIYSEISNLVAVRVDMIEWRIDYFENYRDKDALLEILQMIRNICDEVVLIATIRTKQQGGQADISEQDIIPLLELIADSGCVDIIDIEFFTFKKPEKLIKNLQNRGAIVLSSHHDFEETPEPAVMEMLLDQMSMSTADIVKLAAVPDSPADVLNLLQVTNSFASNPDNPPIISMSMGNKGMITRICGEVFGSCVTFGAIGKGSAPGQIQCDELRRVLQFMHNNLTM